MSGTVVNAGRKTIQSSTPGLRELTARERGQGTGKHVREEVGRGSLGE